MYECPRCIYTSKYKSSLKNHFERKNVCQADKEDVSIENCIKMLNEGKLYNKEIRENNKIKHICLCGKQFDRKKRIQKHRYKCEIYNKHQRQEQTKIQELEQKIKTLQQKPVSPKPNLQFVYILQEREFINNGENIYKIGKTINPKGRMGQYPKGSKLLGLFKCENCDNMEQKLIILFDEKFIKRRDIGNEYYEGDINLMTQQIMKQFV